MLKSFLPLFAMTFFIVLFIVLMQFLWRYIDDLVGKGLGFGVIAELFFYAAVSMVPMALPLAILLASLMTFGNIGEKFELTAMKASGISLIRVMSPLIATVGIIAVGAFFFQNDILPKAQVKMWTLLFSMRQKSPELEIPESVFYDKIPGFNLYVRDKNRNTGMLYDALIYDIGKGGDNATVITADSARLAFTPDMRYLYLHLHQGEQFENLRDQSSATRSSLNTPFRRETFVDKQVLIPFDANFNRLDEEGMRNQYVGKNISQLRSTMDSIGRRLDSIGRKEAPMLKSQELGILAGVPRVAYNYSDIDDFFSGQGGSAPFPGSGSGRTRRSGDAPKMNLNLENVAPVDITRLIDSLPASRQKEIYANALSINDRRQQQLTFRAQVMADDKKILRRHDIELIKKFTLSVACVIFFFIGAPLGAIIRKGGLGTPLVISVLLFLVYYIIDNTGYKMARDGKIEVWIGMWLSTFILAPLGVYVTWTAMNDSAVFDKERIMMRFRKILGVRTARSVGSKEVIINDIIPSEAIAKLENLKASAALLAARYSKFMTYSGYWLKGISESAVAELSDELENTIEYLTDSRDPLVINKLGDFPVLRRIWIYHPARKVWLGYVMMALFPVGLPIYLAGLQTRRDLLSDCRRIEERSGVIMKILRESGCGDSHGRSVEATEDDVTQE